MQRTGRRHVEVGKRVRTSARTRKDFSRRISEQDAILETFSGKRGAQSASGTRPECKVQEWVDPISEQDAIPERFSGKRGAQRAKAFFGSG